LFLGDWCIEHFSSSGRVCGSVFMVQHVVVQLVALSHPKPVLVNHNNICVANEYSLVNNLDGANEI